MRSVAQRKWQRRLLAIESALRERVQRARPFPDYEHLDALLRWNNMPEFFQPRVKQVIEGVRERQRLEGEPKAADFAHGPNGAVHPELPLGPPEWLR